MASDLSTLLHGSSEEELQAWITNQRFFASKAAEMSHFGVLDVVQIRQDPPLAIALLEARFNSGTHDLYQLIMTREGERPIFDALREPDMGGALVDLMCDSATVDGVEGSVRFHWTGTVERPPEGAKVRPLGVEQSNTSFVIGDELIVKAIRRVEPGDNPELEMLRFLSEHGFEHIAPLAGWYEFSGPRLETTLGVAQAFVPAGRDGWAYALEDPQGFLERVSDLGAVTGRMHTTLAADALDPAFAPEEPNAEALGLLTAMIDEEIERTFLDIEPDDERLGDVATRGEEIRDRLTLLSHASVGGRLIRHHGDYHLGQTLLDGERWVILDFEGEPARSLPERRRKRSPLRDVAGMLRSFAYAASAAELIHGTPVPEGWEEEARTRFLEGYYGAVDPGLLPAGQAAAGKLLAIFELEKAVYELRYELNNRPDWLPIPVAGIRRLLDAPLD